jgi:hypothetical protein
MDAPVIALVIQAGIQQLEVAHQVVHGRADLVADARQEIVAHAVALRQALGQLTQLLLVPCVQLVAPLHQAVEGVSDRGQLGGAGLLQPQQALRIQAAGVQLLEHAPRAQGLAVIHRERQGAEREPEYRQHEVPLAPGPPVAHLQPLLVRQAQVHDLGKVLQLVGIGVYGGHRGVGQGLVDPHVLPRQQGQGLAHTPVLAAQRGQPLALRLVEPFEVEPVDQAQDVIHLHDGHGDHGPVAVRAQLVHGEEEVRERVLQPLQAGDLEHTIVAAGELLQPPLPLPGGEAQQAKADELEHKHQQDGPA